MNNFIYVILIYSYISGDTKTIVKTSQLYIPFFTFEWYNYICVYVQSEEIEVNVHSYIDVNDTNNMLCNSINEIVILQPSRSISD